MTSCISWVCTGWRMDPPRNSDWLISICWAAGCCRFDPIRLQQSHRQIREVYVQWKSFCDYQGPIQCKCCADIEFFFLTQFTLYHMLSPFIIGQLEPRRSRKSTIVKYKNHIWRDNWKSMKKNPAIWPNPTIQVHRCRNTSVSIRWKCIHTSTCLSTAQINSGPSKILTI